MVEESELPANASVVPEASPSCWVLITLIRPEKEGVKNKHSLPRLTEQLDT